MGYQADYAAAEPGRSVVDALPGVVVLEFGAPWCGHCMAAQPTLKALLDPRPGIQHLKIEDGRGRPLGRSFMVRLWPTVIVLRDGVEAARVVRPRTAADLEQLEAAL
jgi:thioredoxin 1